MKRTIVKSSFTDWPTSGENRLNVGAEPYVIVGGRGIKGRGTDITLTVTEENSGKTISVSLNLQQAESLAHHVLTLVHKAELAGVKIPF